MTTRVHISIPVTDLEKSIHFYEALLGTKHSKKKPGYANFRLDEPAIHLSLLESPNSNAPANGQHFGVELSSSGALLTHRVRVTNAGIPVVDEEGVTCCFAKSNKFWTADPDGNRWEYWFRLADAENMYEAPPNTNPKHAETNPDAAPKTTSSCCPTDR